MSRVIHFEIHAEQPERAIAFYSALLGWTFTRWGGPMEYWTIETGPASKPGINGGLLKRMGPAPTHGQAVNAYVCTVQVDDLEACMARAQSLGAAVALPKMPVPGIGWLGYLVDTEGNIFGAMQDDPKAA
jgi:hypothetical protein